MDKAFGYVLSVVCLHSSKLTDHSADQRAGCRHLAKQYVFHDRDHALRLFLRLGIMLVCIWYVAYFALHIMTFPNLHVSPSSVCQYCVTHWGK